MAAKFNERNHQEQYEMNEEDPDPNRQKAKENETTDDVENETPSITNICYDFQRQIFDFLDLESLLMVACTCKQLQNAAAAHFGSRFGKKDVWFTPSRRIAIHVNKYDAIDVCGLKLCLPFLRCFGANISRLRVFVPCCDNNYYNRNFKFLLQYINKYCPDALMSNHINSQKNTITFRDLVENCLVM